MTGPDRAQPLRPEDLELLDYIIEKAIENCMEGRRNTSSSSRERDRITPDEHRRD